WARDWFGGVSACVVDSEHDRRALADHLPSERLEVIAGGIDTERYAYRRIGEPGRLVFTGNLGAPSDLEAAQRLATSILPRVRRRVARAQLVIAGTDTAGRARELGRLEGVRVDARLGDLRPSVWGAAVYVSPAAGGSDRTARIVESLALGTPVVASAASLSRLDAVEPGHHVLAADGDADVADAVALLMREPVVASTLARNARALVERARGWRTVTQRYEAVYRRLGERPLERAA
ncbi:MAG TPA: glycosyltransferase, partial [Methylomirabilota bacterium]